MKVDIVSPPPPLKFGEGPDAFSLRLKRWSGDERAMVIDAHQSGSLTQLQLAIEPLVIAWENVTREDGTAIALHRTDEHGRQVSNFSAVMGAAPLATQYEVIAGIIAFMGIPVGNIEAVLKQLRKGGEAASIDPTGSQAGSTPGPA